MSRHSPDDWIGALPDSWRREPMSRWFRERREIVSDTDFPPLSVTMQGLVPQLENVAKSDNPSNRKLVRRGDFAINSRSDRKGSAGVSPRDGSVSVITTVLQSHGLNPRFMHFLLRSQPFQEEFFRHGHGIVDDLWTTRWSDMKSIKLPVPPSETQEAIADYLDRETAQIDAFIAKNEELIALLTYRRQAVGTKAVMQGLRTASSMQSTNLPWFGDVPAHWRVSRLSRWFSVTLGKMLDQSTFASSTGTTQPYIRAANIRPGRLDLESVNAMPFTPPEQRKFSLKRGDLLVVEGGSIGVNVYLSKDLPEWGFQKTVNRVRSRGRDSTAFLGLQLDALRAAGVLDMMANVSTILHLTAEKLERTIVAMPPIEEQRAIVRYVESRTTKIDKAMGQARRAIDLARERRAALISAAVTGKIDVLAEQAR